VSTEREVWDEAPVADGAGGDAPGSGATEPAGAVRLTVTLWSVALVFGAVTFARSEQVGIPLRDPDGAMFRVRLASAAVLLVVLAVGDAVVRSARPGWSWRRVVDRLRLRWTPRRAALVASGLVAYHVVYVCYRNLKSWDAFNTSRDAGLLALEKALFLGHSPAVLLHELLGEHEAAHVLAFVYRSFTYLVPLSVVGALALLPRVRDAYVFLCSAIWVWILGVGSYYLVPTLGPFASAPGEFAGLAPTAITSTQAEYLAERSHLLANPAAGDAFASISAFASLHVAFTCMVLLLARYFRWRRTATVLTVYLAAVMVSTIYFGWHFVVDDLAGILLALVAVALGRLTVRPPRRREPDRIEAP
jgi:membrane-associated phospholipid phosphatase